MLKTTNNIGNNTHKVKIPSISNGVEIEKRIYKVVFKGKKFSLPVIFSRETPERQKVFIKKNSSAAASYLNLKS